MMMEIMYQEYISCSGCEISIFCVEYNLNDIFLSILVQAELVLVRVNDCWMEKQAIQVKIENDMDISCRQMRVSHG